MPQRIYKYDLGQSTTHYFPKDSQILSVSIQHGSPVLWALVDIDAPAEKRTFCLIGTGWVLTHSPGTYIGTLLVDEGMLVLHVFETTNQGDTK